MYSKVYCFILMLMGLLYGKVSDAKAGDFSHSLIRIFDSPKHEVRAVWITTIGGLDWPGAVYAHDARTMGMQQAQFRAILDRLKAAGINTVLLQTRVRATTIYPSKYEPWDGCLSGRPGVSPGYDALAFAIEECHKRGMELHAWVVAMPVGRWNSAGCARLRNRFPSLIKNIQDQGYMDPENPETANYLGALCEEITKNYDIDGIHLDYIRYPETWRICVSGDQGRRFITNIVTQVHDKVKAAKPWVKMSCSPIGKFSDLSRYKSFGWNAYNRVCQDAQAWLKQGLMDQLYPMMYFKDNQFYPFAIDWKEQSMEKAVAPGLGIYFLSPKEKNWNINVITREMQVLRSQGLGIAFFRSRFFTDDVKGIYSFTRQVFNVFPALIPPIKDKRIPIPQAPQGLNISNHNGGMTVLSWSPSPSASSSDGGMLYNVYASSSYPVDITSASHLVAMHVRDTHINIGKPGNASYYAVTAMDRYGNESLPLQLKETSKQEISSQNLLTCDGYTLKLPSQSTLTDPGMILIETLQGNVVHSKTYRSTIDVSHIQEGVYLARTLSRKGVSHRLGFFVIRRK